ncbi:MAG TPA: HlyD family efflux transporter periplasmic adaptor subunit [Anaerolineaceae bacterium]|nr:HlyD family efflux transporter periplasmic adaptor subunit [Anaerolineaceae bacterium]
MNSHEMGMRSIRFPARKRALFQRKVVWVALIAVLVAGGAAAWFFLQGQAQTPQNAQTESQTYTATVRRGDIVLSASGSGTLAAGQSVDLSFSTSGTVVELNVNLGDWVKRGDVLARLGNADNLEANLASARLSLLEAQQALQSLQQNADLALAQAHQDWLTAQESYAAVLRTSQRTAYARCSQEVNTRNAETLERAAQKLDELTDNEYGSNRWIAARDDYETALANYNNCIAYSEDEKLLAQSSLEIAQSALRQAEATYQTLKDASGIDPAALALAEAEAATAQATYAQAQADLEGIALVAPMDGKVTYLAAAAGAAVDTATFLTIADLSHPVVNVSLDETDLDKFLVGSTATVTFDALPDLSFTGEVVQVDPALTASGQYWVINGRVALDEEAARTVQDLPLGLNASVTIVSRQASDVVLAPVMALRDLGDGQYAVMRVAGSGEMTLQLVEVGIKDATYAEILSGLQSGDVVSTGIAQAAGTTDLSSNQNPSFPPEGFPPADSGMMPPP